VLRAKLLEPPLRDRPAIMNVMWRKSDLTGGYRNQNDADDANEKKMRQPEYSLGESTGRQKVMGEVLVRGWENDVDGRKKVVTNILKNGVQSFCHLFNRCARAPEKTSRHVSTGALAASKSPWPITALQPYYPCFLRCVSFLGQTPPL
jgi:hypothetical protein